MSDKPSEPSPVVPNAGGGSRFFRRQLPILFVLLAAVWSLRAALWRDLWFDEALTLLNFAFLPSFGKIYFSYVIPNNQILHTMLLRLFAGAVPLEFLRFLPALAGLGTLLLLYRLFRVRLGGMVLLPVLTAFALSLPFAIYGTALRGYMLSAFFVVAALGFAMNYARAARRRDYAGYALFSLLAIGAIPSNLIALAGVVLYVLPLCGGDFCRRRRFWLLAATPPAALLLFYAPIAKQFLGCLALKEGWENGLFALRAVYSAFLFAFAMFILPVVLSLMPLVGRAGYRWLFTARLAIFLLPVPACLLLAVAPFPRVFFPLWPLWLLLVAAALRRLCAWQVRLHRRWSGNVFLIGMTAAVLLWGAAERFENLQLAMSKRFGGAGGDDYFLPYYMRDDFRPAELWQEYRQRYADRTPPAVYLSFAADPWALMWAGRLAGLPPDLWHFDGPRGQVASLPTGSLVILTVAEHPDETAARFRGRLTPLYACGRNAVFRFTR